MVKVSGYLEDIGLDTFYAERKKIDILTVFLYIFFIKVVSKFFKNNLNYF